MGDLYLEIYEMVRGGLTNKEITDTLNIPVDWVEEVREDVKNHFLEGLILSHE